jgi:hypothetical protein
VGLSSFRLSLTTYKIGYPRYLGHELEQEIEPLTRKLIVNRAHAGNVAAGSTRTGHQTGGGRSAFCQCLTGGRPETAAAVGLLRHVG